MTVGIGRWARSRLAEHRAVAEYRQAWRSLRRLHSAATPEPNGSDSERRGRSINTNVNEDPQIHHRKENQ